MRRALTIILALVLLAILGLAGWLYAPDRSRAALDATYFGPDDSTVEVAGVRLHVRDTGPRDAPAIVLLHGFGSSLLTWEPWAVRLSTNWRVVRFDLPGFGLTGPDPTGDYSDARSLQVVGGLMDALGIGRASLVGNSMGGRIAWTFAARQPARVDRLVLVSPDGFRSAGFEYGKAPRVPWMLRLLPYVLPAPLLRASLAPAYADAGALTPALLRQYRDMLLGPGVRGAILARTAQTVLLDPVPLLREVTAPTLLLWGVEDRMIPVANAADYLAALPDGRLVELPGLGHVPFEEAPDRSLAPVRAFLE